MSSTTTPGRYTSSACVYPVSKQRDAAVRGLREEDAYPAEPEDGYGWEKLTMEHQCRHYREEYGMATRVVRLHNIYGPLGAYVGGREWTTAWKDCTGCCAGSSPVR